MDDSSIAVRDIASGDPAGSDGEGLDQAFSSATRQRVHRVLEAVNGPADIATLPVAVLPQLCREVRDELIHSVARSGGHFASNLGVVELTVAILSAFDSARDRIVWDVGHQAYVHKMLTGRRRLLSTIRKSGGLSGFPSRDESGHDAFGTAHSSTSISAAMGMAVAAKLKGLERRHVAIIGDGALTAGMAYEALCNAAGIGANLLIIVNDNQMSISRNTGAIPAHLQTLVNQRGLQSTLDTPDHRDKGESLFSKLGVPYVGPVDGHDVEQLARVLRELSLAPGLRVLHVRTQKGHGYPAAAQDPIRYHGPGPFDPARGLMPAASVGLPTYSQVFGRWLADMARADPSLVAVTPAMIEGSGMVGFAREFPTRCFDVGIAEQHALTFAAGLACDGLRPVVAIYSTFLQRAYDQLIHDIALQSLPVLLAIDRAGLVGADGATHAGSFDIASLRAIPNMCVMTPADENECRQMLTTGFRMDSPAAVRYPRGCGPGVPVDTALRSLPIGRAKILRKGLRVAILAFGSMCRPALEAGDILGATVVNMRFVKPLDLNMIARMASTHELLVTVEEACRMGGAGSAVHEALNELEIDSRILQLGLPDVFIRHGEHSQQLADVGLDAAGIVASIDNRLGRAGCRAS